MNVKGNFMKKYGCIALSLIFLGLVGCATSQSDSGRKDAPTVNEDQDREQIQRERMLMFQLKHI